MRFNQREGEIYMFNKFAPPTNSFVLEVVSKLLNLSILGELVWYVLTQQQMWGYSISTFLVNWLS